MVTLYRHIAESADDAREASGTVTLTDIIIESDATTEWLGFRFQNVLIPPGSTITNATVSIVPSNTPNDEPNHTFFGVDEDNAAQWAVSASNISGRSLTTASVVWSSADLGATGSTRHASPSLHTIVQEIVDRAGWASGNAMAFAVQGNADAARDLDTLTFDFEPGYGAHFEVTYTPPLGSSGVSKQIAQSADDAFENAVGSVTLTDAQVFVDATNEYIGLRFQSLTIPRGAVISAAWLSMQMISTDSDPNHTIYGDDADSAAVFTTAGSSISGRSATTATATWSIATDISNGSTTTTFFSTPELKTVIQEIVDRAGWASGNNMALIIRGSATATRDLGIPMYDGTPANAAKLDIVYVNVASGGKGSGGKGKGGNQPGPGEPPKKPLRTSLSKSWKWDRGWR